MNRINKLNAPQQVPFTSKQAIGGIAAAIVLLTVFWAFAWVVAAITA